MCIYLLVVSFNKSIFFASFLAGFLAIIFFVGVMRFMLVSFLQNWYLTFEISWDTYFIKYLVTFNTGIGCFEVIRMINM